jgi:DNA-binding NarL/FixJ family response regulator
VTKKDSLILLSPREKQTISLLIRGLKNCQIAKELGVSEKMVEKILTKIFLKTNTQCRTELVVWVLKHKVDE